MIYTRVGGPFAASTLIEGETLHMPAIGLEMPTDDLNTGLERTSPAAHLG